MMSFHFDVGLCIDSPLEIMKRKEDERNDPHQ